MKNFAISILTYLVLLTFSTPMYARTSLGEEIEYERINPGNVLYSLKRLKEKSFLLLLSPLPSNKTKTYESVLKSRLGELKKIIDEKNVAHIEKTSQRYSAAVGEYTDHVSSKNPTYKKEAKELLEEHKARVQQFLQNFDGTTAEWRFVKHDVDYIDLNLEKLVK